MTFIAEPLPVTAEDIEAVFDRYVSERVTRDSPRYAAIVDRQARKLATATASRSEWQEPGSRRTVSRVDAGYDRVWSSTSLAEQVHSPKTTWFEWRDQVMVARTIGRKHVHQLLLVRALEWLRPATAVEVGFGNGFNLMLLSMQCPDLLLGGVELTEAGVAAASVLSHDLETQALLSPFAVNPILQTPVLDTRRLLQGSGGALPLASKSVDVAFTVLALEQMEDIREAALAELVRVARRHVIMIEPFREWNADGLRRSYIEAHHYFDQRVSDLGACGLRPIVATADFPNKVNFFAGLVVADVMDGVRRPS